MVEVGVERTFICLYSPDYDTSCCSASSPYFILSLLCLSGTHYTPSVPGQFMPQKIPPNHLQNVSSLCHPKRCGSGQGEYTSVIYKYLKQQVMKLRVPLCLSNEIILARTLSLEVRVYLGNIEGCQRSDAMFFSFVLSKYTIHKVYTQLNWGSLDRCAFESQVHLLEFYLSKHSFFFEK